VSATTDNVPATNDPIAEMPVNGGLIPGQRGGVKAGQWG
jgi:hypothetical protein